MEQPIKVLTEKQNAEAEFLFGRNDALTLSLSRSESELRGRKQHQEKVAGKLAEAGWLKKKLLVRDQRRDAEYGIPSIEQGIEEAEKHIEGTKRAIEENLSNAKEHYYDNQPQYVEQAKREAAVRDIDIKTSEKPGGSA